MQEFSNYSSHLPVFELLLSTFDIRRILEFGVGKYSTPFFAEHCAQVLSVEQESQEWHDKLAEQIKTESWNIVYEPDPAKVFAGIDTSARGFDLVFSDGAAESRCLVANLAMERGVPFVALHDAEKVWYYQWNLLRIPASYSRFNYRHRAGARKVTTLLANANADRVDKWNIPHHERVLLSYSSPGQPIIFLPYTSDQHFRETGKLL